MTLCIDIGNSNVKCGVFQGDHLVHHWRMASRTDRTVDEYSLLIQQFLAAVSIKPNQVHSVAVCCVVPSLEIPFDAALRRLFETSPIWIGPDLELGLEIRIDNSREIGADLLANAVAAYGIAAKSCIAVDFGTALSFTAINRPIAPNRKAYIAGVAIAPGIGSALSALDRNTAQLSSVLLSVPPQAIGTNTINSIQSGLIFGYTGLVEGLIRRMTMEMAETPVVIATGWMSELIAAQTDVINQTDPWLTLKGVRLLAEKKTGALKI